MSNTFLFTWEEEYLLHEDLRVWKQAFLEKYGEQWLFIFRSDDLDKATLLNAIYAGGMFSTKKLVVIYGIPKDSTPSNKTSASISWPIETYLIEHRATIPADTIVILVSYKPDKRTKTYKFFSKNAQVKTYEPLKDKQLIWFIQHKLWNLIGTTEAEMIVSLVWWHLFNIANECEKLKMYADYHWLQKITNSHIHDIVFHQWEIDSFQILDNLFSNKEKALQLIEQAQQQHQDTFQFLWMLYRGLKLVIQMIDLHEQWVRSSKEIASIVKLHPFAVAKQYKHIDRLVENKEWIHNLLHHLVELDRSIKSWTYPPEWFWLDIKSAVYAL
jgi:DNA polymerase III delta subunit